MTTEMPAPTQSMRPSRCACFDSVAKNKRPMMMIRPRGALMLNAQRQEKSVASQPPSTGPTATIPPMVEPQIAKAIPRSLPWKVAFTSDSVVGSTIAPPIPCTMRAKIIVEASVEKPAQIEARVKMKIPIIKSLRRPMRSPIVPQTKSSDAKTST